MRVSHVILLILVMAIWGFSFIAIKEGLKDTPPFLLCSLRFFLTAFPAIFFVKKPKTSWAIILSYGFFMFVMMFSLAFLSLEAGLTAGLASLLIQFQIFFTVLLAFFFFKEKLSSWQLMGMLISLSGIVLVGEHFNGGVNLPGFLLILGAALAWGCANIVSKKAGNINMVALIIWGSAFAWPLLFVAALLYSGREAVFHGLIHLSGLTWGSLFYMAYPATLFGFSLWSWLLSQHKAASITPFGLLVPFFGMAGSILFFDEPLQSWKLVAAVLVIGGLFLNLCGKHISAVVSKTLRRLS